VDLGDERRTLVAGLKKFYKPEELVGKKIAILCNLKPAKIRGVESRGMLLAAQDKKDVGVLVANHAKPGDVISGSSESAELSMDEFQSFRLEISELKTREDPSSKPQKGAILIMDDGKNIPLEVGGQPVLVDKDIKAGSRIR
jgi:methionyl-tRNA synthetase